MESLDQIDTTKPIAIYGLRYVHFQDTRELDVFARKADTPDFFLCADSLAGPVIYLKPDEGKELFTVLQASKHKHAAANWHNIFEQNLQQLATSADGWLLLTTWVSLDEFQHFLQSPHSELFTRLQIQIRGWRELGIQEVGLDGYERATQ